MQREPFVRNDSPPSTFYAYGSQFANGFQKEGEENGFGSTHWLFDPYSRRVKFQKNLTRLQTIQTVY